MLPFTFKVCRISGDRRKLYDLRGLSELPVFCASAVQPPARDAYGVMQIVELFAVESYGLLRTPAETFCPRRETKRDRVSPLTIFNQDFNLLVFAA